MANHFAGLLDLSPRGDFMRTHAWAGMVGRAGSSISRAPGQRIETVDLGRLFVATLSFSHAGELVRRRSNGAFVVAGDPICCEADEEDADIETSIDVVGNALLGSTLSGLRATRGTFAAMAWDSVNERLSLTTDKLGIRPLYVSIKDDCAVFATTLRVVLETLGARPAWDETGLAQTVYFQQCFDDFTPYAGIRCLSAGQMVIVKPAQAPERQRYFELSSVPQQDMAQEDIEVATERAFVRAVRRRSRAPTEQAFLSGGMDSRLLVDTLLSIGRRVETFSSSYAGSIDDVIGAEAAERLGTCHVRHHRNPAARLRLSMDLYSVYAREHFPSFRRPGPKAMWSGDGGSVTFGHVYMTERAVEAAAGLVCDRSIDILFPTLSRGTSRQLGREQSRRFKELARESAVREMHRVNEARPDRRAFLFAMNNDQARHLHPHFEHLDRSEVEFVTPFFDADFASLISSLPIGPFLRHAMYNRVLERFHPRSAAFFWQSYPGHVPSPHPAPAGTTGQWSERWSSTKEARGEAIRIADEILHDSEVMSDGLLDPWTLRLTKWLLRAGSTRYNYEVEFARRIAQLYHA